jgi:hypothetical protein
MTEQNALVWERGQVVIDLVAAALKLLIEPRPARVT